MITRIWLAVCLALLCRPCLSQTTMSHSLASTRLTTDYSKLPLRFEMNRGQTDARVKFLARGLGYTLFLTPGEAVLVLQDSSGAQKEHSPAPSLAKDNERNVFRMKLLGADPDSDVMGTDEMPGRSNYFVGNDTKQWHTNVSAYAKVRYKNIYSGIDLIYYGNQRQLEYDFVVAPGAEPRHIEFDFRGTKHISLDERGDLVLKKGEGEVRWHRPLVYQETGGTRQEIAAHYVIRDQRRVGFEIASYDTGRTLFIDPLLYSTYLGGSGDEYAFAIAVDSAGNAYVTGQTSSLNFPLTNPEQPTNMGGTEVFVAKLNSTGSALVYSTYLGGSGGDIGYGVAVDSSGNAYVTGSTSSTNFPTVTPLQPAFGGGGTDAFLAKLDPTGSVLVYSTYLGGSLSDTGQGIAVDSAGNAYVTGQTSSTNFPTRNALQPASGGGGDAFLAKVNPTGSALVYSTYLGGSASDDGYGIAVDSAGNAYIIGTTFSTNFPTENSLQSTNMGGTDAFVAKLNPAGSALVYSTYLGGSGSEVGIAIAADNSGNAYVTGYTSSTNFPVVNSLQAVNAGGNDAFVAKIDPTGSALVYSTYLGGNYGDTGQGIAVDSAGNAYVTGITFSTNFPTVNPLQARYAGGGNDAFVAQFNPAGSALVYSTYLGGSGIDFAHAITVDSAGNAYVAGGTGSTDFPTVNPLQPANAGSYDAFLVKISSAIPAVTLSPASLIFGNQTVNTTSAPKSVKLTNAGAATLNISSITASGNFAVSSTTCGATLAATKSCNINVTFMPPSLGSFLGTLTIADSASNSPQTASLTGAGVLPVTLTPGRATYAIQTVGTSSPTKTFTLTNNQSATLDSIVIGFTGADPGDFTVSSTTCGSTLASKGRCTINVVFKPTATGTRTANLSVSDDASNSPQTSALTGTGK